ncbi:S-methyl-5'-thioadenosine phosphorylase [Altererythrobacter aquiaggeris]|uniref:phosphorylase family protein n=1 Tax=Aestuarierythrobacter aquiaggeris TaxID=1898396 RepID=UPI0030194F3C
MTDGWHIGVIGGSGLYDVGQLDDMQQIDVESSFGKPSGRVTTGSLNGVRFTFLPRHGEGHVTGPAQINYRANIDVLKRCGVTDVLAVSAIGSLIEALEPGHFAAVTQFIDQTKSRPASFFGDGVVAHVSMADPTCERLTALVSAAAAKAGAQVHAGGCYVAIEGPQFSTRAESQLYREFGGHVIGMTGMPEARLAREAELPYALLGMITDYDCWRYNEPGASMEEVFRVMRSSADLARAMLVKLAESLPETREASPIDTTLDGAIATARDLRDPELVARLDAVAGRALSQS